MDSIKFISFPTPNLEIDNLISNFSSEGQSRSKKTKIYPKLLSIYNYDNFKAKKIKLENSQIVMILKIVLLKILLTQTKNKF